MKKILDNLSKLFVFSRKSKYLNKYMNESNMRSSIYMSVIIIAIEIWMIIRRFVKTLPDKWNTGATFYGSHIRDVFMLNISFILLIIFGVTMIAYALFYLRKKHNKKTLLSVIIPSGILIIFSFVFPLEISITGEMLPIQFALLISFYISLILFGVTAIATTIYGYKDGKHEWIKSVLTVSMFALVCLVFGMRVSYLDYAGGKEIICFLMMSIYVGCLLIWKPYISVAVVGGSFALFYAVLRSLGGTQWLPEKGDTVNFITFLISLLMICISIYDQRARVAIKDEQLEEMATKDKLTSLYSFEYFIDLVKERIENNNILPGQYIYLFLDITSFKIINDQRGFEEGNVFLKSVGDILTKNFPKDLVTRQSDDHYVIFAKDENVKERLAEIDKEVEKLDLDIRPGIKVGAYPFKNKEESHHKSVEKARYACATLKNKFNEKYVVYDDDMHRKYRLAQYVVHHIDEAVEKGALQAYFQPVVWSNDGLVCSLEALARWEDEKYGFLAPDKFISALEDAQLIHKLDFGMLEAVCRCIKHNRLNSLPIIPVSINFSRLDFALPNIVETICTIVDRHKVPHEMIYIEITESALLTESDNLKNALKRLKEKGFEIWLDDFGSGYSSLTALKDYEFDVIKLDMKFLSVLTNNQKTRSLIKSVISMAKSIGTSTLCEGVEREEQAEFLRSIDCQRLQGYLYGKPLSSKQLEEKINKREIKFSKEIKKG